MDVEGARAELTQLMGSWEYAFAMGHGCSIGRHPTTENVLRRVEDLRALIQEHAKNPH